MKKGAANRCVDATCHLTFAGYVIAGVLTILVAGFSAFSLLYWRFDLPHNGNSICYALLAMSLTLWAKPLNRRRTSKKKKKKSRGSTSVVVEEEVSEGGSDAEGPRELFLDSMVDYTDKQ